VIAGDRGLCKEPRGHYVLQCPRLEELNMESVIGLMLGAPPAGGAPGDGRVPSPCASHLRKFIVNHLGAKIPQPLDQLSRGPALS